MQSTAGLRRGTAVNRMDGPIRVPVGEKAATSHPIPLHDQGFIDWRQEHRGRKFDIDY